MQVACIPPILAGRDVIASAETGTGKTATFLLPILQKLAADPYGIAALVLTPTRELALQIAQQVAALGARIAARHYVLVGGVDEITQAVALRARPHVVVATPGRLAVMVRNEAVDLSRARFLVLDEADRLLDAAYREDLACALDACSSPQRQTLMFSATMTPAMEMLNAPRGTGADNNNDGVADSDNGGNDGTAGVFRFDAHENRFATVAALRQRHLFVPANLKEVYLVYLLKVRFPKASAIVFAARCETVELLVRTLALLGMRRAAAMHSDMPQVERVDALQKFKGGKVRVLIATDVASRGLDVPLCEVVINYDVPRAVATYVHRVGRTARAGRGGVAVSLVAQTDVGLLHAAEAKIDRKIGVLEDVGEEDVMQEVGGVLKARSVAMLELHENGYVERNGKRRAGARETAKRRMAGKKAGRKGGIEKSARVEKR